MIYCTGKIVSGFKYRPFAPKMATPNFAWVVGHNCTHGGADKCLFSWDARKRYLQKLRIGGIGLPDPFGIDEGLWSEDVKRWPTMEFGDL